MGPLRSRLEIFRWNYGHAIYTDSSRTHVLYRQLMSTKLIDSTKLNFVGWDWCWTMQLYAFVKAISRILSTLVSTSSSVLVQLDRLCQTYQPMDSHIPHVEDDQMLADSSDHTDHPSKDRNMGYCSLPPEIRNQIMRLVLVPGQIHIRPSIVAKLNAQYLAMQPSVLAKPFFLIKTAIVNKVSAFVDWIPMKVSRSPKEVKPSSAKSGCQLLATCRQVYHEGHVWFYSLNTFYIPRGPLSHTLDYFNKLQPNHRALMKTIGIRFGLQDLTSRVLEAIDRQGEELGLNPRSRDRMTTGKWAWLALKSVDAMWKAKLVWIRDWTALERVKLESAHGTLELEGSWLQTSLKSTFDEPGYGPHGYRGCSREVATFMLATFRRIRVSLGTGVFANWERRKQALLSTNLLLSSDLDPRDHSPGDFWMVSMLSGHLDLDRLLGIRP